MIGWFSFLSLRYPLDGRDSGPAVPAAMAAGGALGIVYGAAARAWMRLIAPHPEFSVDGTAFIVFGFALVGSIAGLVLALRRRERSRILRLARTLLVVVFAGLAGGAGAPMGLTTLLGTLAIVRRRWPAPVRVVLAILAVAPTWLVILETLKVAWWRGAPALAIYFALLYPLVVGMRTALEPRPVAAPEPVEPMLRLADA